MPAVKRVLIWRNELLPASETFIASQAASMRRYHPHFAGLKHIPHGIHLDPSRRTLLTQNASLVGKLHRRIYIRTGFAPVLERRLKDLQPALIHAHFAPDGCAALPVQKKLDVPLIVTLHGYDVTRSDNSLDRARREELWQRAALFICVSKHIRQAALRRGFPAHKLWVHHIGTDLCAFTPSVAPRAEPVILFAGRLVEKKGCTHLIRAMSLVQAKLPSARLVVIGDGPRRTELEKQARRQILNTTFLGAQPSAEVRHWMRRAQLLAFPSIVAASGDTEGLPIVLCEAQAIGLPIAGFRGPGVDEAVIHGYTALLADPPHEDALAAAILRLLEDSQLRTRLATAGRLYAEKHFDLRRQTALLEDKYDELLSSEYPSRQ